MKRTLILLMSAAALIVVLAISVAMGWEAHCTTYYNGGWQSCYSNEVLATSSTGYVICDAPYSPDGCSERWARALRSGDNYPMKTAYCNSEGAPSAACCKIEQWTPSIGTYYKVLAYQRHNTNQSCGPITGTIQSSSMYECAGTSPGRD